ncbi:MAG: aminotransferase class III-fold pyridoxal phosphate-dependent enzyme, partial [Candidatus Latescibacterota bacterium]|nr:aminotransferase class III-fold pyridoxal phosphate-dependent enzyme [Candidatus Latescibacterota bacterium]
GFGPMLPGISFGDFNDLESVEKLVDSETAAVLVEPLQAEGGIHPADVEFLKGLRSMCDEMGMLLIFDEIQCGLCRTGTLWCYEQYGVTPDIMTLAKPLAGGFPIGATLMTQKVADAIDPGDHAATFGAHPVSCAVAVEVFKKLSDVSFVAQVNENGDYLISKLEAVRATYGDKIKEIRGRGLIVGAVLNDATAIDVMNAVREHDVIVCVAGPDVVRFLPPLITEKSHIDEAVDAFESVIAAA